MTGIHKRGHIQNDGIKVGIEVFDIQLWVGSTHRAISEDTALILAEAMDRPDKLLSIEDLGADYSHLRKQDIQTAVAQTTLDASKVFTHIQDGVLHPLCAIYENLPKSTKTTPTPLKGMLGVVFNSRVTNNAGPCRIREEVECKTPTNHTSDSESRSFVDIPLSEAYAQAENPVAAYLRGNSQGATAEELVACIATKHPGYKPEKMHRLLSHYLDEAGKLEGHKIVFRRIDGVEKAYCIRKLSPYYTGNTGVHSQLRNLV